MNKDAFDVLISEIDKKQTELETQKEQIRAAQRLMQNLAPRCENCAFFIQHYIASPAAPYKELLVFRKISEGHCTHGRLKNKKSSDPYTYFEPKQRFDYEQKTHFFCKIY